MTSSSDSAEIACIENEAGEKTIFLRQDSLSHTHTHKYVSDVVSLTKQRAQQNGRQKTTPPTFVNDSVGIPSDQEDPDQDQVQDERQHYQDPGEDLPDLSRPGVIFLLLVLVVVLRI